MKNFIITIVLFSGLAFSYNSNANLLGGIGNVVEGTTRAAGNLASDVVGTAGAVAGGVVDSAGNLVRRTVDTVAGVPAPNRVVLYR